MLNCVVFLNVFYLINTMTGNQGKRKLCEVSNGMCKSRVNATLLRFMDSQSSYTDVFNIICLLFESKK